MKQKYKKELEGLIKAGLVCAKCKQAIKLCECYD